jgi:GNAT superfamily N-acetyltransferase
MIALQPARSADKEWLVDQIAELYEDNPLLDTCRHYDANAVAQGLDEILAPARPTPNATRLSVIHLGSGKPVGFLALQPRADAVTARRTLCVQAVAIQQRYRHRGLLRDAMRQLPGHVRALAHCRMTEVLGVLSTLNFNEEPETIYQRRLRDDERRLIAAPLAERNSPHADVLDNNDWIEIAPAVLRDRPFLLDWQQWYRANVQSLAQFPLAAKHDLANLVRLRDGYLGRIFVAKAHGRVIAAALLHLDCVFTANEHVAHIKFPFVKEERYRGLGVIHHLIRGALAQAAPCNTTAVRTTLPLALPEGMHHDCRDRLHQGGYLALSDILVLERPEIHRLRRAG